MAPGTGFLRVNPPTVVGSGLAVRSKLTESNFRAGGRPRSAVREDAMKLRISGLIAAFALAGLLGSPQSFAQNAYITECRLQHRLGHQYGDKNGDRHDPVGFRSAGLAVSRTASRSMSRTWAPPACR
jgi:hypothetical protein